MMNFRKPFGWTIVLLLAGVMTGAPAWAEKPDKAGGGKPQQKSHPQKRHEQYDQRERRQDADRGQAKQREMGGFMEHQGAVIRDFYAHEFRAGKCPPGLAKKNNGCLPPGQIKRWEMGRPLPRDLVYYDLPASLIRQIGYPPTGYRYVRVANDILMITIGTGLVVDAIADLTGMP
ncbi:RcnB family protein [Methylomonas sp. SURF-2]|uniref:RcnB family protein n=1 Tax=Methylomonas subterranea TaxID=2952225 RepID=A0ABT1TGW8_9GAMM|nr:RcnB family protein [Methylomonas sp. SURF-2]MCQ8104342.1 RcnB family protein [Methylomonas sp. SURF-2]